MSNDKIELPDVERFQFPVQAVILELVFDLIQELACDRTEKLNGAETTIRYQDWSIQALEEAFEMFHVPNGCSYETLIATRAAWGKRLDSIEDTVASYIKSLEREIAARKRGETDEA